MHCRSAHVWFAVLLALLLAACSGQAFLAPAQDPAAEPAAPAATQAGPTTLPTAQAAIQATATGRSTAGAAARTLTVFAAASLTESFNDLARQFEAAHPSVKVVLNYAGSQQLSAQLVQGAPADVFASANGKEMNTAIKGGVVVSGTEKTFARNRLMVVFPQNNPGQIARLADLAKPGIKLDLADKSVPVGQYTLDMLDKMSQDPAYGPEFEANVLKNVVSYENDVKTVATKVGLGEADAGLVYATDVTTALAPKLGSLEVPDQFNQIASYPIATVARASQPELARQFVALVLSDAGQQVLAKHGFITAPEQ